MARLSVLPLVNSIDSLMLWIDIVFEIISKEDRLSLACWLDEIRLRWVDG
jgi:hypothetical protein